MTAIMDQINQEPPGPFMGGKNWSFKKADPLPKDKRIHKQINKRDIEIKEVLNKHVLMTGIQLSQMFFSHNKQTGKQRYNALYRTDFLKKYLLETDKSVIPVFAAKDNGLTTAQALKILVSNQIYLRLKDNTTLYELYPQNQICSRLQYKGIDFYFAILRGWKTEPEEIMREVKWATDKKVIIVVPSPLLEQVERLARVLGDNVRYTTDIRVFKGDLSEAFLTYQTGQGYKLIKTDFFST